jgi:hypothetical protein
MALMIERFLPEKSECHGGCVIFGLNRIVFARRGIAFAEIRYLRIAPATKHFGVPQAMPRLFEKRRRAIRFARLRQ